MVRVARLHDDARPAWGWHAFGARSHACSVACAASRRARDSDAAFDVVVLVAAAPQTAWRVDVDRTSPAAAAAERMFSVESDEQLIRRHVVIGRRRRAYHRQRGRGFPARRARRLLGKRLDGGGGSFDFDCGMNVLKIDVHLDCSAVATGAICVADWRGRRR